MLADVQGRVFWPEPKSVESAGPARLTIFHGTPALMVRAPSKIVVEIPENASSFSGYFGIPEEAYTGDGKAQGVEISIAVQDRSGQSRLELDRFLQPLSRADDRGRFSFRVPIDSARDRSITLTTGPGPSGRAEGGLVSLVTVPIRGIALAMRVDLERPRRGPMSLAVGETHGNDAPRRFTNPEGVEFGLAPSW